MTAETSARPASSALLAGAAYFAVVFACGFVLGALRVLALAPALGELAAVSLELPVMLAISWFAARWLVARLRVPPRLSARLAMGGAAFALLMLAEAGVSMLGFGRTLAEHLGGYATAPALLGLAGQIVFALIPAALIPAARRT